MSMKSLLRFAMFGTMFSLGMYATSALACKGSTLQLRDDFTDEDPAWGLTDRNVAQIGNGALAVNTAVNTYFSLYYQGMNFPAADA
jgi:hypothetical protein